MIKEVKKDLKVGIIVAGKANGFNNNIIWDVRDVKNVCDKIIRCVLFFRINMIICVLSKLSRKGFDATIVFEGIQTVAKWLWVVGGAPNVLVETHPKTCSKC